MKVSTLLNRKSKWIKFALAKDKDGTSVYEKSSEAVSFCLVGALIRCYSGDEYFEKATLVNSYVKELGFRDTVDFNNSDLTRYTHVRKILRVLHI